MYPEQQQDRLPEAPLQTFAEVKPAELQESDYEDLIAQHDLQVLELEEADLQWKLRARKIFSGIFTAILVLQNTGVAWLLYVAYRQGQLESLAMISSGLSSARWQKRRLSCASWCNGFFLTAVTKCGESNFLIQVLTKYGSCVIMSGIKSFVPKIALDV